MPFVVVQLANFMEPSDKPQDTGWSQVRESQRLAAKNLPNAELACIIDLGEGVDIHPLRKREVAQRIALGFEHILWNKKVLLSPEVTSSVAEGNQVVLSVDQSLSANGPLYEFEVAGTDGRFVNAEAVAQGDRIVITSPIAQPSKVRYAWKSNPINATLTGKNGLPVIPFEI
jgi:sialate O-acetylesterase